MDFRFTCGLFVEVYNIFSGSDAYQPKYQLDYSQNLAPQHTAQGTTGNEEGRQLGPDSLEFLVAIDMTADHRANQIGLPAGCAGQEYTDYTTTGRLEPLVTNSTP